MKKINLPLTPDIIKALKAGDEVLLCGMLYTARDAAHKRFCENIRDGKDLPVDLTGNIIYYCGNSNCNTNWGILLSNNMGGSSGNQDHYCYESKPGRIL